VKEMAQVFQDTFAVETVNPEKKVFDRIDRLLCKGKTYDCQMIIDVNSELWKVREGETIVVTLATSLTNGPDDGTYRQTNEASLLDTVWCSEQYFITITPLL
jgi:DNA-directed RNA polymerase I, II, and III subunit RPABC3